MIKSLSILLKNKRAKAHQMYLSIQIQLPTYLGKAYA